MNTSLDGKTLAECQGYHIKPVRTANSENKYKFVVLNNEMGNKDTAIVVWLSRTLAEKYNDGAIPSLHESVLRLQSDEETGEATHYLLTSKSNYLSIDALLAQL